MSTLSSDIQSAIQKNLPAEVAVSLQNYLKECESLRSENEKLKQFNKEAHDQNAQYVNENLRLATDLKKHGELAAREKDVVDRENQLDVQIARLKQEAAERRAEAERLMIDFFASTKRRGALGVRKALVFRIEAFNIFNRTQAGNPGTTLTSPASFGLVNTGLNRTIGTGTARQLQLALRLNF